MSAARKELELTPEARRERGKRRLVAAIDDLVEASLATAASSEFYDQDTSPLKRRRYLLLARTGKFPSKKEGKRVLVRREDLHAYLEREGISRGTKQEDEDVEDILATIRGGGRR